VPLHVFDFEFLWFNTQFEAVVKNGLHEICLSAAAFFLKVHNDVVNVVLLSRFHM
jgi:hypothetical protein